MPEPHEQSIRGVFEPYLAGQIRTFGCPPVSNEPFQCDGTLGDGGVFHVGVVRAQDGVLQVGPIVYDGQPPSRFVGAVRDYIDPNVPPQSIACRLTTGDPSSFECDVYYANGSTKVQVGRQSDGSMRIYGVKVETTAAARPVWLLPLAAGFMLFGVLAIVVAVVKILRIRERSLVARLPLAAQQTVRFPAPGTYVMHAHAPRFSTQFGGLRYTLTDPIGREVRSFPTLRTHTSGLTHVQMALRRFFVETAGEHVLRVDGVRSNASSDASLIFTAAWPLRDYLWIALVVAGGFSLFLGILLLLAA